jgi:hypothetical protein
MSKGVGLVLVAGLVAGGCGGAGTPAIGGSGGPPLGSSPGGAAASSSGSSSGTGSGTGSGGGAGGSSGTSGSSSSGVTSGSGSGPVSDASAPPAAEGGAPSDAGVVCYSEPYDPSANIADVAAGYTGQNWLSSSLTVMQRRYPTGYFVLAAQQNDSQLPEFVDTSSWGALMSSMMTVLDAETTGWDFDNATATEHPFVIVSTMQITVPILTTWEQGTVLQYITDDATQTYDQTELGGEQGAYDGVFLLDAVDSACNGLAAATAVGDQIASGISARDGAAANLYYLELYLRAGRTSYATEYAAIKADPNWQKLVRYEWARVNFWDGQAKGNPNLQIAADPIWADINLPASLAEIQMFTGESPGEVACNP